MAGSPLPTSDVALPTSEDPLARALDAAFWPALIAAGLLFAAAGLAPSAAEWRELRHRLAVADAEQAALRREVAELARVATALRTDPAFAAELARLDLGLPREGGDRLAAPAAPPPVSFAAPAVPDPPAWPGVTELAASRRLRAVLAGIAAALTALAFTLCQPSAAGPVRRATRLPRAALRAVLVRYRPR